MIISVSDHMDLHSFVKTTAGGTLSPVVQATLLGLAEASVHIARLAAQNGLGQTALGDVTGAENADGDNQKALDVLADQLIEQALQHAGLHAYLSEEREQAVMFSSEADLVCACDPLDGSSNIDTNLTIGTIFSIYPRSGEVAAAARAGTAGCWLFCLWPANRPYPDVRRGHNGLLSG